MAEFNWLCLVSTFTIFDIGEGILEGKQSDFGGYNFVFHFANCIFFFLCPDFALVRLVPVLLNHIRRSVLQHILCFQPFASWLSFEIVQYKVIFNSHCFAVCFWFVLGSWARIIGSQIRRTLYLLPLFIYYFSYCSF